MSAVSGSSTRRNLAYCIGPHPLASYLTVLYHIRCRHTIRGTTARLGERTRTTTLVGVRTPNLVPLKNFLWGRTICLYPIAISASLPTHTVRQVRAAARCVPLTPGLFWSSNEELHLTGQRPLAGAHPRTRVHKPPRRRGPTDPGAQLAGAGGTLVGAACCPCKRSSCVLSSGGQLPLCTAASP